MVLARKENLEKTQKKMPGGGQTAGSVALQV